MIRAQIRHSGTPIAPSEAAADQDDAGFGPLVRAGVWGGTAAACLLLVALATRTEIGHGRLAAVNGSGSSEDAAGTQATRDAEVDARRLNDTIRSLIEDRDRLLARVSALERNYEDVTGSIGRLATTAKPPTEAASTEQPAPAAELPPVAGSAVPAPSTAMAPPKPAAAAPSAPGSVAAAPTTAEPAATAPAKGEFGVDIGGGPTLAALRAAWDRIRRNHASLFEGLSPVIAVRDRTGGQVELRLVVGPIANAANAARLCASLAAAGLSCQPTMFEGQRLAQR